jgi:hypothetical protein
MERKITPTEFKAAIRTAIGAPLRDLGFLPSRAGILWWERAQGDDKFVVAFPLDKYGWMPGYGGSAEFRFHLGPDPHPFSTVRPGFAWFNQLLTGPELAQVQAINNTVARSLPRPCVEDPSRPEPDAFKRAYCVRVTPYRPLEVVKLHYYRLKHLDAWGAFLSEMIVPLVDRAAQRFARVA